MSLTDTVDALTSRRHTIHCTSLTAQRQKMTVEMDAHRIARLKMKLQGPLVIKNASHSHQ